MICGGSRKSGSTTFSAGRRSGAGRGEDEPYVLAGVTFRIAANVIGRIVDRADGEAQRTLVRLLVVPGFELEALWAVHGRPIRGHGEVLELVEAYGGHCSTTPGQQATSSQSWSG